MNIYERLMIVCPSIGMVLGLVAGVYNLGIGAGVLFAIVGGILGFVVYFIISMILIFLFGEGSIFTITFLAIATLIFLILYFWDTRPF